MRALLDGVEVFLDGDQLPGTTLEVSSVLEPGKAKGNRSTTINIIRTKEVEAILGSVGMAEDYIGESHLLEIGDNDSKRFNVIAVQWEDNAIRCVAIGGNASWFEYAKKTRLGDIDFGNSPVIDSAVEMVNSWTDEDRLDYWGIIDNGYLIGRASGFNIPLENIRPSVRLGKVLEKAFEIEGWNLIPRGELVRDWAKFIGHFATNNLQTGEDTAGDFKARIQNTTGITPTFHPIILGYLGVPLPIDNEISDPAGLFNTTTRRYTASGKTDVIVDALYVVPSTVPPSGWDGRMLHLEVYDFTDEVTLDYISRPFVGSGPNEAMSWSHRFEDIDVPPGNEIGLCMKQDGDFPSGDDLGIFPFADITFHSKVRAFDYDSNLNIASAIGNKDITVEKALMMLLRSRNIVFNTDDNIRQIELWYHDDYYRVPSATSGIRDWSDRTLDVDRVQKMTEKIPNRLTFKYKEDSSDINLEANDITVGEPGYGNREIELGGRAANKTITNDASPTHMGTILGGDMFVPRIHYRTDVANVDHEYKIKPRLLFAGGVRAADYFIGGVAQTEYPYTYFHSDRDGDPTLHYGGVRRREYDGRVNNDGTLTDTWGKTINILRTGNILRLPLRIYEDELKAFDFGLPTKIDDGTDVGMYWVERIQNHRNDRALVRAVKIPTAGDIDVEEIPCQGVSKFGRRVVDVDYFASSHSEVTFNSEPDGTRILIVDHATGTGTGTWYENTGHILIKNGASWDVEQLAAGDAVFAANSNPGLGSSFNNAALIVAEVGGGGYYDTGLFALPFYSPVPFASLPAQVSLLRTDSPYSSIDSNRSSLVDSCRWFAVEYTTDFVTWNRVPNNRIIELGKYDTTFSLDVPVNISGGAIRLAYYRGVHFQGNSIITSF